MATSQRKVEANRAPEDAAAEDAARKNILPLRNEPTAAAAGDAAQPQRPEDDAAASPGPAGENGVPAEANAEAT